MPQGPGGPPTPGRSLQGPATPRLSFPWRAERRLRDWQTVSAEGHALCRVGSEAPGVTPRGWASRLHCPALPPPLPRPAHRPGCWSLSAGRTASSRVNIKSHYIGVFSPLKPSRAFAPGPACTPTSGPPTPGPSRTLPQLPITPVPAELPAVPLLSPCLRLGPPPPHPSLFPSLRPSPSATCLGFTAPRIAMSSTVAAGHVWLFKCRFERFLTKLHLR